VVDTLRAATSKASVRPERMVAASTVGQNKLVGAMLHPRSTPFAAIGSLSCSSGVAFESRQILAARNSRPPYYFPRASTSVVSDHWSQRKSLPAGLLRCELI
jgi:hypothetical protein